MRTKSLTQYCHAMINASPGITVIAAPDVEVPQERMIYYGFERLLTPDSPTDMGLIADPARFAAPLHGGEPFHADFLIKAPGTDFYLPDMLARSFGEVVGKSVEAHYSAGRACFHEYCMMHISQGTLEPGVVFRAGGKHIDALYEEVLRESYPNNDCYTISSSLPMLLYDQPFAIDISKAREKSGMLMDFIDAVLNLQAREEAVRDFGANHIVRHDSFMVHSAQPPKEPTERTFLMVRFFPAVAGRKLPEIGNRFLAEACGVPLAASP